MTQAFGWRLTKEEALTEGPNPTTLAGRSPAPCQLHINLHHHQQGPKPGFSLHWRACPPLASGPGRGPEGGQARCGDQSPQLQAPCTVEEGQSAFTRTLTFHWEKPSYLKAARVEAIPMAAADELPGHASLDTHFCPVLAGTAVTQHRAKCPGQSRAPRTDRMPASGHANPIAGRATGRERDS